MKPKEPTYQVVLDALALTTCYPAFLITAEVPVPGKQFDEPPSEEKALSFIRELGHSREIRVQILWGMYYKKNLDFVALIWEDLAYQIDNIDSKKQDKMDNSLLESVAYKTYYAIAFGAKPPKSRKCDGIDLGLGIPDEQHRMTSSTNEGTGTKPGVTDVPLYESKSEQESWGDSKEDDDDDEDDSEDKSVDDNDDGDDDNDDGDHDNDNNDDDEETDSDRTELDRIKILVLYQSSTEHAEEEEEEYIDERVHTPEDYELTNDEKIDDKEKIDEEEDDEVTKELYKDVNVNLGNKDVEMTDADQGGQNNIMSLKSLIQSSSISSDFTSKLLNFDNTPPRLEKTSSQTSSLFTVPVTEVLEITSATTVLWKP
ncbi:hypothetical protein Tco_0775130 [Tanacetum coccineum]